MLTKLSHRAEHKIYSRKAMQRWRSRHVASTSCVWYDVGPHVLARQSCYTEGDVRKLRLPVICKAIGCWQTRPAGSANAAVMENQDTGFVLYIARFCFFMAGFTPYCRSDSMLRQCQACKNVCCHATCRCKIGKQGQRQHSSHRAAVSRKVDLT